MSGKMSEEVAATSFQATISLLKLKLQSLKKKKEISK